MSIFDAFNAASTANKKDLAADATPAPQSAVPAPENKAAPALTQATLDQILNLAVEQEASDVHLGTGSKIALRAGGKILFIENVDPLSQEQMTEILNQLLPNTEERKRLERLRELDFSYTHSNGVSFRVNAFYQRDQLAAILHMSSKYVPGMDDLGIPQEVKNLLTVREGLLLVCGPAGSGKSTSIQAMLEYINENFVKHIITIENPIEHVFENKRSIFTQREVGKDTLSLGNALQAAVRQDANVIMINEITSPEVMNRALELVETGHLVIASLTTKNSVQALERIIGFFPPAEQTLLRHRLAESLLAILSQDLVQRKDRVGLTAIYEFMLMTRGARDIVRRGQFNQIRTLIESSPQEGMITMDAYAYQLAEQGVIDSETAKEFSSEGVGVAAEEV